MKNHTIITFVALFGFFGINAQTLLTCTGSKTGAKISFMSKSGQDIKLKVDWDEGSTFSSANVEIKNGTCVDCSSIGGIGRPNGSSKTWTIRQTNTNAPVSIAWATTGTIKYCGGNTQVNVPMTAPVDPNWKQMPAVAKQVIAGGTKTFVIGTDDKLYEWNYTTKAWVNAGRTVVSAAVDFNNSIWTIEGNKIFRFDGSWKQMPAVAKQVIAGGTKVFVIGTDDKLYEWNFSTNAWVNAGRTVVSAAVDANNSIWTIEGNKIFRFDGSWKQMPAVAKQVIAGGTKVFAIGTDDNLYEWNFSTNAWVNVGRTVKSAAVDLNNTIWTIEGQSIYSIYSLK